MNECLLEINKGQEYNDSRKSIEQQHDVVIKNVSYIRFHNL